MAGRFDIGDDDGLDHCRVRGDGLFRCRQEGVERLGLQLPHSADGVQIRHLALGEHFLLDIQDRGVDLVRHQGRHVFAGDANEVDVFRIDPGGAQNAAAKQVGESARLLNADALSFQIFRRLDFGAHHLRGFELRQIGRQRLHRGAIGAADDGRRTRRQAEIDVAGEQRALDFHTIAQRNDVDIEPGLFVEAEFLGDDHRHVHDIGRRGRNADPPCGWGIRGPLASDVARSVP